MSKLRTYQLQNPDSATVNIELDQSGGTTVSGILTASSGVVGDVTGNVTGTATTATNLADGANITTGTLSNDRLPATITKNLTGNVTGNLTGDVTGNVTGNLTGDVTGGITTSQITIGDAFIKSGAVGLGTTTTAGINAGVSTATGTLVYIPATGIRVYSGAGGWKTIADTSDYVAPTYTKRGIIFHWDPANVTGYSNGDSIVDGSGLSSGVITADSAANTNVFVNGGSFTYQTAQGGHFNTNGRISVNSSSGTALYDALDACSSMTITCWFQSNGASRQVLVSRFGTGFPNQFNHIVDPTGDFHYNSSGPISGAYGDIDNATNYWSNNTWHLCHWIYNVSNGVMSWYIDGSLKATNTVGTNSGNGLTVSSNTGFGIASRADRLEDLAGKIGPVRIHNVVLTSSEITTDWNVEKTRFGV